MYQLDQPRLNGEQFSIKGNKPDQTIFKGNKPDQTIFKGNK